MGRPTKQWFDQRAIDGFYWTITVKRDWRYNINQWLTEEVVEYRPVNLIDAHKADIRQYGKMTQDEAIAMAKLLNASETN
jgi:hypothetical protein